MFICKRLKRSEVAAVMAAVGAARHSRGDSNTIVIGGRQPEGRSLRDIFEKNDEERALDDLLAGMDNEKLRELATLLYLGRDGEIEDAIDAVKLMDRDALVDLVPSKLVRADKYLRVAVTKVKFSAR